MSFNFAPAPNIICLIGQTLKAFEADTSENRVKITTESGKQYLLYYSQDCCENVKIESIQGYLSHLVGAPILEVTEKILSGGDGNGDGFDWPDDLPKGPDHYQPESYTWTTFTFTTSKGTVRVRWYGESNGYYSESVSFCERFNPSW
jgi:hypothetical protein